MKQILAVFCVLGITGAQMIPPSDPLYVFIRQEFRKTHNLDLFVSPYPWSLEQFDDIDQIKFFPGINKNNVYLRFTPSIQLSKRIPYSRLDLWISAIWGNFSFLAEPVMVNEYYGESILGETYKRGGFTGRFVSGFIQYKTQIATIQFGRKPVWWGQSWESSVIQSGKSPPYEHVSIQFNLNYFHLELLSGQLHSGVNNIGRFKRYLGGKRLTFISKSKRLLLTVGDMILYSGINRSIEWQYLNPIIPYIFSDLEKETEHNDNNMIFIYGRAIGKGNLSVYFELLVDDFQIDIENRDKYPDALGSKIGIDGTYNVGRKEIGFEIEYTRISGYTYITREWFTNWEDRGIPIGYQYGPDCQSLFFKMESWITENILFSAKYTYLEKGELTLESEYDPYGKVGVPFPYGDVKYFHYFSPSFFWYTEKGVFSLGWNGNLNDLSSNTFYIDFQLIFGKGLIL